MELFSETFYVKEIIRKESHKVFFKIILNDIVYEVFSSSYNWLLPDNHFIGYGRRDIYSKKIYLETIIPCFSNHAIFLFQSFLIDAQIPGLTQKKITLLYNALGNKMIDYFYQENFELINSLLQYEQPELEKIQKKWQDIKIYIDLHVQLKKCCLSASSIKKVYKAYKHQSLKIIQENPFKMIFDIGFGWKTVDKIAKECGIKSHDKRRIEGAISFLFLEKKREGHTCLNSETLYEKTAELLNDLPNCNELIDTTIKNLVSSGCIKKINTFLALVDDYTMEKSIYDFFAKKNIIIPLSHPLDVTTKNISNEQKIAIEGALGSRYSIITGSAGTGKSTIILEIYTYQVKHKKKIIVLTPTGRASQRILEMYPNIVSMTIHKFFIINKIYIRQEKEYINQVLFDYEHIIIDESSMIDSMLLSLLLRHTLQTTQITFIGDSNQLPPVGLGGPFHICIQYQIIPVFTLKQVFRQKEGGKLLELATTISKGICPKIQNNNEIEFHTADKENLTVVLEKLIDSYYNKEKKELTWTGVTFLNRGNAGTKILNTHIQEYIHTHYHPAEKKILHRFYRNDSVIITHNNYKLDVRNGEMGKIIDGDDKYAIIRFNKAKEIMFTHYDSHLIDLGYAINVYKSQGSEFPLIVLFIFMEHYILLHKKALYTAITRTKNKILLIGQKKALYCAVKNKSENHRQTILEQLYIKS
jgi:exodeoxyribonuclease V alpha subunit